jgi:excisionase family DNA binding protein
MNEAILLVSEVSRVLNLSAQRVRALSDQGKLRCTRSSGGVRLFRVSDVEKLRTERNLVTRTED